MKKISAFLMFSFFVLFTVVGFAQDQPAAAPDETPAAVQPVQEQPAAGAVKPADTVNVKPAAVKLPAAPQNAIPASAETDALTLIETADGDFRYTRIQGMTFQKKAVMEAGSAQPESSVAADGTPSKGKWKVWGLLLFVILITFFLYRFGNTKRRGKVLRRFPK